MNEAHLLPHWRRHPCCTDAGIVVRLMAGCTTGAMAVAFAQPTDVVKVRFQAQVRLTDGGKRYNGTLDAYKTIARDEGVRGLWKGRCLFTSNFNFIQKSPQIFKTNINFSFRLHAKHHPQRHCELCRAGHLWHNQRTHPEVWPDDRWGVETCSCRTLISQRQNSISWSDPGSVFPQTICRATSQPPSVLASAQQ